VEEVTIQRDDRGRIFGLVVRDIDARSVAGTSSIHFLRTVSASLSDYLHVPVEMSLGGEAFLAVDRSDIHLDRELDAILETLVMGFKVLEKEYPADLVVHEATVGVEV